MTILFCNANDQRSYNRYFLIAFTVCSIGLQGKDTRAGAHNAGSESVLTFSDAQHQT